MCGTGQFIIALAELAFRLFQFATFNLLAVLIFLTVRRIFRHQRT